MQLQFSQLLFKNSFQKNGFSIRYLFKESARQKQYKAKKLIGFSKLEIYEIVADVQSYDKFLPFCTKSTVLSHRPKEMRANLVIGFPPIVENYDSTVLFDKPNIVKSVCTNGTLFYYLESTWIFHPGLQSNTRSCIIDFSIKFNFKSVLYSQVASLFFDRLVQQMESAFMNEAARRYGKPSIKTHILNETFAN
ncbi:unnamed protein product [Psylliodes chrysocephalus]|uniref:Coenzyme Q-binding protein COQ10 START domain-containing protein n=1 Tax=Psylliodes chrysocephalus TaxID=3402493 RepID=A0A9P0CKB6_9CUCU|nr:unnamed protein product [Psylliodes chrysocephala]